MDDALVDSVLQLKPAERLRLLEVIYGSLDRPDTEIDETWYEEAKRRLAAFEAGKVRGLPDARDETVEGAVRSDPAVECPRSSTSG